MFRGVNSSNLYKYIAFSFFAVWMLFVGFFSNHWSATRDFKDFAMSSESLVIGRLAKSEQDGVLSAAGLLGWFYDFPSEAANIPGQYDIYLEKLEGRLFRTYNGQVGFQGICFSLIDLITDLPHETNLKLFKGITAFLSAVSFTLIILWFIGQFGFLIGFILLLFLTSSSLTTSLGRNLYWQLWAFYVPMIASMVLLAREERKGYSHAIASAALFIAVLVKCLFNGCEYITTTLIMMIVPFFYYAIQRRWTLGMFLKRASVAGVTAIISVLSSFSVLVLQISIIKGSYKSGYDHIIYSFLKRTHGSPADFPSVYAKSLDAPLLDVLEKYFNGPVISLRSIFQNDSLFEINLGQMIVMFSASTALFFLLKNRAISIKSNEEKLLPLVITTWASILAPMSWFTIFKAHSYIHPHINNITWFMPFVLFGLVFSFSMPCLILTNALQYLKQRFLCFASAPITRDNRIRQEQEK